MKSAVSVREPTSRNSSSSSFVLRQVKYVYDCWKPTMASACIMRRAGERLGEEDDVGVRRR